MITESQRQAARTAARAAGHDPDEVVSISGPVRCGLDGLTDGPEMPIWMSFIEPRVA